MRDVRGEQGAYWGWKRLLFERGEVTLDEIVSMAEEIGLQGAALAVTASSPALRGEAGLRIICWPTSLGVNCDSDRAGECRRRYLDAGHPRL